MGVEEARSLARRLLEDELPRRWAHTQGVAARAGELSAILGNDAELVEVAAWLHDIGYSPVVRSTGFHPLDGARFLRDVVLVDETVCCLVAHHSGALVEADERGITELSAEFDLPDQGLLDALTYSDMTADVDGCQVGVDERLSEILTRYPSEHVVHRAVTRSGPDLRRAALNVQRRLAG
jgi:putative nucleotidyltransferase with HDIG domain